MNISSPFDVLAQTYDADFTVSRIGRLQRERVWYFLGPLLKEMNHPLNILEINCGTGEDALRLAALGHTVIATDASAAMIQQAKMKSKGSSVEFLTCPFEAIATVFAGKKFDLVLSNFGGLNCVDAEALTKLSRDLALLTTTHGRLFLVLLSDRCAWEMLHYSSRGKLGQAFRRFKKTIPFTVDGQTLPVHYYSPGRAAELFAPQFGLQKKYPVGLFIPPSYLEKKFLLQPGRLNRLNKLEYKFGKAALSRFADHFCTIFQKKAET